MSIVTFPTKGKSQMLVGVNVVNVFFVQWERGLSVRMTLGLNASVRLHVVSLTFRIFNACTFLCVCLKGSHRTLRASSRDIYEDKTY